MADDPLLSRPAWAPAWLSIDDVGAMRWFRRALWLVLSLGVAACVVESADSPADPELGEPTTTDDPVVSAPPSSTVAGPKPETTETTETTGGGVTGLAAEFGTVIVDVMTATGEAIELCLLHADEATERSRGLMGVTDLEGHDGMLFSFDADTTSRFFMLDTPTPLSISWWDASGAFVSGLDMAPCTDADAADCERYPADGPYRFAVEVVQGDLPEAAEGATIALRPDRSCTPGSA